MPEINYVYRASHVLVDLGWVDFDFGSSPGWWAATVATYCPSRPGGTSQIQVNKTQSTRTRDALHKLGQTKESSSYVKSSSTVHFIVPQHVVRLDVLSGGRQVPLGEVAVSSHLGLTLSAQLLLPVPGARLHRSAAHHRSQTLE